MIPKAPWQDDPEVKAQKKFNRVMRNAIFCAGIGIGLLLVKPFFIGTEEAGTSESTAALLGMIGLSLIGYGALIVVTGLFARKLLFKVNLVAMYIVLPALILKAVLDWQS